jgi:hypothetical protein
MMVGRGWHFVSPWLVMLCSACEVLALLSLLLSLYLPVAVSPPTFCSRMVRAKTRHRS